MSADRDASWMRAAAWGLRLLFRSAPVAAPAYILTVATWGLVPNISALATARLIGLAPGLVGGGGTDQAMTALVVLVGALVSARVAVALSPLLLAYVRLRYQARFDAMRMDAGLALPGLEHFESPALADRMMASSWAASGPRGLVVHLANASQWSLSLTGGLAIISRLGWWVPAAVLASAVPAGIAQWRHGKSQGGVMFDVSGDLRHARYHADLASDVKVAGELRLFGVGEWLSDQRTRLFDRALTPVLAEMRRQNLSGSVFGAIKSAGLALPLVVASIRLRRGDVTVEDLAAVVLALGTIGYPFAILDGALRELVAALSFLPEARRLSTLAADDPRLTTVGSRVAPDMLRDGIRLEGVSFTYPGSDRRVLDGVDLHIPAGLTLALVGENGAGKSTLIKLLCRFYDPDEGRITIDGVDLREFDLESWRARVAVVFQDLFKLPINAADNVAISAAGTTSMANLVVAAGDAGFGDVVAALPDGWDTVLARDFGGVDLSGGEWQRLGLARAVTARLTRPTPILVLDEPTAAMDVRAEHELFGRFSDLTRDATSILISHRFSTVRMADVIAVLEGGRVIESGAHDALIAAAGRYAELFELQARRFRDGVS